MWVRVTRGSLRRSPNGCHPGNRTWEPDPLANYTPLPVRTSRRGCGEGVCQEKDPETQGGESKDILACRPEERQVENSLRILKKKGKGPDGREGPGNSQRNSQNGSSRAEGGQGSFRLMKKFLSQPLVMKFLNLI
ncbi:hypothetical protein RUM43_000257 [Polyplax serrata]|uniref:Uncharacterized protein n=1 Tax=Polyplax serrata TaxID=468196 RepID=A0AAN8XRZ4_POLSC